MRLFNPASWTSSGGYKASWAGSDLEFDPGSGSDRDTRVPAARQPHRSPLTNCLPIQPRDTLASTNLQTRLPFQPRDTLASTTLQPRLPIQPRDSLTLQQRDNPAKPQRAKQPNPENNNMSYRVLILLLFLLPGLASADRYQFDDLPSPDARGDFSNPDIHRFWMVVDPAPAGLNARKCPVDKYDRAEPPVGANILELPVVRRFPKGTELSGNKMVKDDRNRPWFEVEVVGDHGTSYLVRASNKFLKPVHNPFPKPDSKGNYNDEIHQIWEVVDPDPAGLNGRLHPDFPESLGSVVDPWPTTTPDTWPVVTAVPAGTWLRALHGNRGTIVLEGSDGEPWMLVTTRVERSKPRDYSPRPMFFVRSNKRYIKPIWP